MKKWRTICLLLLALLLLTGPAYGEEHRRLAIMIGASWSADKAMHNDLTAMHQALEQRGFHDDEILSMEGKLSRTLVLGFLNEIGNDVAAWKDGDIFLYYTGHGSIEGKTAKNAIVGLQLSIQEKVSWDEVFAALRTPPKVRLILLPDS